MRKCKFLQILIATFLFTLIGIMVKIDPVSAGTYHGSAFLDKNDNNYRETGEPGIGAVTLRLVGGGYDKTETTDEFGNFQFKGVPLGKLTLRVLDFNKEKYTTEYHKDEYLVLMGGGDTGFNIPFGEVDTALIRSELPRNSPLSSDTSPEEQKSQTVLGKGFKLVLGFIFLVAFLLIGFTKKSQKDE